MIDRFLAEKLRELSGADPGHCRVVYTGDRSLLTSNGVLLRWPEVLSSQSREGLFKSL